MNRTMIQTAVMAVVIAGALGACAKDTNDQVQGDGWLTGAPDQQARTERLEQYLRGFDQPMWEIGERYQRVEQALRDENWELAAYHWDKIKSTLEGGVMKRPARGKNAEALFLGAPWQDLDSALAKATPADIGPAFARAKNACMACHAAENVAYMNDQPLFREPLPLEVVDTPATAPTGPSPE